MMGDIPCLYYSQTLHQSAHTNTPTRSNSIKPQVHTPGNPINFELFGGGGLGVVGEGGGGGVAKMNLVSTNPRDFKQQHTSVLA
jgi:hypothetical protein